MSFLNTIFLCLSMGTAQLAFGASNQEATHAAAKPQETETLQHIKEQNRKLLKYEIAKRRKLWVVLIAGAAYIAFDKEFVTWNDVENGKHYLKNLLTTGIDAFTKKENAPEATTKPATVSAAVQETNSPVAPTVTLQSESAAATEKPTNEQ